MPSPPSRRGGGGGDKSFCALVSYPTGGVARYRDW